jgi:hypothetical protein
MSATGTYSFIHPAEARSFPASKLTLLHNPRDQMSTTLRRLSAILLAAGVVYGTARPAAAQNRSIFVLGGYGTTTYQAAATKEFPNDFSASVSPVILYTMGQDLLFETELEFALDGPETETGLEYAQIDYLGFENFQIIAGKFLLPFGVFGERVHPTWINKLPTRPVVYGHGHGGVAENGLVPVLADAGAMVRWTKPVGTTLRFDFSGYVTQGPGMGEDEDAGDVTLPEVMEGAPPVSFGVSFPDNNTDKMFGARAGLTNGAFAVYLSGFQAAYDDAGTLNFSGGAISAEWRTSGFEFRGEMVGTRQDFLDEGVQVTQKRSGYYAQASRRFGRLEPVARWGELVDGKVNGESTVDGHRELAVGVNYWLRATIPVKFSYEFHKGLDDQFYVQWAYGF